MSNELAVISGNKSSARLLSHGYFESSNLIPIWCDYNISEIAAAKGKTPFFFLILPNEVNTIFLQICYYLRDVCIEEEKTVYAYGPSEIMSTFKSIVPKIFVSGIFNKDQVEIADAVSQIAQDISKRNTVLSNILMIDDNPEYVQELSIFLKDSFNTYIIKPDEPKLLNYIRDANIVIINIDMKMKVMDQAILFNAAIRRQSQNRLKILFMANSNDEQKNINLLGAGTSICLSKTLPSYKIASYLIKRYSQ